MRQFVLSITFATVLLASRLNAQTTVHSTFGPGDTFGVESRPLLSSSSGASWYANQFTYTGPSGMLLGAVRIAAFGFAGDATVSFMSGSDIATATLLESWTLTGWTPTPSIFSFSSLTSSALGTNQDYWLRIIAGPSGTMDGGWIFTRDFLETVAVSPTSGAFWFTFENQFAQVYDVSAVAAPSVNTVQLE